MGESQNRPTLIIPCARIDNISVAPGAFIVGPPGPTAFLGLVHAMDRELLEHSVFTDDEYLGSVAFISHEFEISPGHRRIPPEKQGEQRNKAGAMIDDPEGYMTCSLVIEVNVSDPAKLEAARLYLEKNLLRFRLAGGRIIRAGVTNSEPGKMNLRAVQSAWDTKELSQVIRSLPPGAVLENRMDLLTPYGDDDKRDALDRLLDVLARRLVVVSEIPEGAPEGRLAKDRNAEAKVTYGWVRAVKGWIVPLHFGWSALSTVRVRPGMRKGDQVEGHVWAEDVVGLGEWVSIRKAFGNSKKPRAIFWNYTIEGNTNGPYVTTAAPLTVV